MLPHEWVRSGLKGYALRDRLGLGGRLDGLGKKLTRTLSS
jgi:hypothetical protein